MVWRPLQAAPERIIFAATQARKEIAMIEHRPFKELGRFQNDWLNANYHFSFSGYHDPKRMGEGALRVWNDDTIQPHTGFPPHGHQSMEIITYVRTGAITHKDSMGNTGRTEAGDVQVMSAGDGVQHSEWNAEDEATTLFQIWILPRMAGGKPGWGARKFPKGERSGNWAVLASGTGENDSLVINQDANVLGATLKEGETLTYGVKDGRHGYLVLAAGSVDLNGTVLNARDGAAITGAETLTLKGIADAEIVFVDTV
jgi:quercetin 2,3-dioxygenase